MLGVSVLICAAVKWEFPKALEPKPLRTPEGQRTRILGS